MAAGRFLGDWLRAHVGAVALVRASAYLAAVGMLLALAVPIAWVAVVGFAIVGLGLANLVPIFFGAGGKIPGQSSGTGHRRDRHAWAISASSPARRSSASRRS